MYFVHVMIYVVYIVYSIYWKCHIYHVLTLQVSHEALVHSTFEHYEKIDKQKTEKTFSIEDFISEFQHEIN